MPSRQKRQLIEKEVNILGKVTIKPVVTVGLFSDILENIEKYDDIHQKANEFTTQIISEILVSPHKSPEEIDALPDEVLHELILLASASIGIKDEFENSELLLPEREKLYFVFNKWYSDNIIKAFEGISTQLRITVSALIPPITELTAQIASINAIAFESAQSVIEAMMSELHESFANIIPQFVKFGETLDNYYKAAEIDSETIALILWKLKLWIPTHATLGLVYKIKAVIDKGGSTDKEIESVFIQYYKENNWEQLTHIVDSWEANPHFKPRMNIFRDALQAHVDGKYTLSVPALLPHIEGIAGELLGNQVHRNTGNQIIEIIRKEFPNYMHSSTKDILLGFIEEILYRSIDFSKLSEDMKTKGINERDFLNRHAILHGVFYNYNDELQSLRAFLLLDALSML